MHYRLLFRPPLFYVTMAECILVAAIAALSWHIWFGRQAIAPSPSQAAVAQPSRLLAPTSSPRAGARATPAPLPTPTGAPRTGPTPGTRTDAGFLSGQMDELNRVEATFENLEWRVTNALVDAIQTYIDRVVLPSIDHYEQHPRS